MNTQTDINQYAGAVTHRPTIVLTHEAKQKLIAYIMNVENEVGGLGSIEINGDTITVLDIFLLEQTVTGASTRLSPDGIAKFYQERKEINPHDDFSSYKLWWHSHHNFSVFWSGTDNQTIDSFDQETIENNFMVSIVGNQKEEMRARVDIYHPFRCSMDNLDISTLGEHNEYEEAIIEEIKSKVKTPKVSSTTFYSGGNNWGDGYDKMTKKERKEWRKSQKPLYTTPIASKIMREVWGEWTDDNGAKHSRKFSIPINSILSFVSTKGEAYYYLKYEHETDQEAQARYDFTHSTDD
jgi:hypothetical protein